MNPLPSGVSLGTLGELLIQIRLLEYGVQAAPPIKDSGNDLIAIFGDAFKAIQVKATRSHRRRLHAKRLPDQYHLLAIVQFGSRNLPLRLDRADIFLLSRQDVGTEANARTDWEQYRLSEARVREVFINAV